MLRIMHEGLAPAIDRIPIGSPAISTFDIPANPSQARWVQSFRNQIKVSRALALAALCGLIYLNHQILSAQGIDSEVTFTFLAIYTVVTYFLLLFLMKMIVGTWGVINNPHLPDHPSRSAKNPDPLNRVAIIFPVYHEDVARVAGGMAAAWESLAAHTPDFLHHYDIFLLSDSRKDAFKNAEVEAVRELRKLYPNARFYYRWRPTNSNAKIGNVTDFCRRWGKSYTYMFTMDADSVVSGETIHATLRMMEGRPEVGILQTNPKAVFRTTIYGRMQQFASHLFGMAFKTALRATLLGNGSYMGHNAMVRIDPFIKHCILPTLSGAAPWGGKPLSHDMVESALMAGHGYETWFLPELEGSWEEVPANILASLIRDRRWMQGNLQHSRIMNKAIFPSAYKEYFFLGVFGYIVAPIWALFLIASSYVWIRFMMNGIVDPETATIIITNSTIVGTFTFSIFIILRGVSLFGVMSRERSKAYGGRVNLLLSAVLEFVFSMIYAPINMLAMSHFIIMWLRRKSIVWDVQDRGDEALSWEISFKHFSWMVLIGSVFLVTVLYFSHQVPEQDVGMMMIVSSGVFNPYTWIYWMTPIFAGAIFAPLVVRWTSLSGHWLKAKGLFLIPEEVNEPDEFKVVRKIQNHMREAIIVVDR